MHARFDLDDAFGAVLAVDRLDDRRIHVLRAAAVALAAHLAPGRPPLRRLRRRARARSSEHEERTHHDDSCFHSGYLTSGRLCRSYADPPFHLRDGSARERFARLLQTTL